MLLKSLQRHPTLSKDKSLMFYAPLDGNALDYKGTNNGTVTGATPVPSGNQYIPASLAYKFNGTSNEISLPISSVFNLNGKNYSLNCFIKLDDVASQYSIFSKFWDGSTRGYDFGTNGTSLEIQTGESGGVQHNTPACLKPNVLQMITFVYNGSNYKSYVNGKRVDVWSTSFSVSNNNANVNIGDYSHTGAHYYFKGNIQEVALFHRALSDKEISDYYSWITGVKRTGIYGILSAAYELIMETGSFTLSGQAVGLQRALQLIMSAGAYTLTGVAVTLSKTYQMALDVGSYILTGFNAILNIPGQISWSSVNKTATNWDNKNKNTSNWSNSNKNTSNWINKNKS